MPDQYATFGDGRSVAGRITGESPAALAFVDESGRRTPLVRLRQVRFDALPRLVSGTTPPRRILLHGDERLHAEVTGVDERAATILGFGLQSARVPRTALSAILQPDGERIVACDDFESRPTLFDAARLDSDQHRSGERSLLRRPDDESSRWRLAKGVQAGRFEMSFYDTGAVRKSTSWVVELEFAPKEAVDRVGVRSANRPPPAGDRPRPAADHAQPTRDRRQPEPQRSAILRFSPGWNDSEYHFTSTDGERLAEQRLARSKGWKLLTVLFDAERVACLVDGNVLATGAGRGELAAVGFRDASAPPEEGRDRSGVRPSPDAGVETWVDDVQLFERVEGGPVLANTQPNDFVRLTAGDDLFGQVQGVDPQAVTLSGRFGRRRFSWSELQGLVFAAGDAPVGEPVTGLIAVVELAPILRGDPSTPDRLVVAIQSMAEAEVLAWHPYLGALRIPCSAIARVVPEFNGTLHLIDPAYRHLGDSIREDFHSRLAEGPRREWTFPLPAAPTGKPYVRVLAADLEPGAPRSSRDGPFRADRVGPLKSVLFINGRAVDELNRHVSVKARPRNPQPVRIAVPRGLLKAGENRLRIEQRPAANDPDEYDDFELSRLSLEIGED